MNSTAQKLRTRLTDTEQKLWHHIRGRQLMGFKFRRQAPIGKYIVDFVCFEQQLIIELDGGQHVVSQEYDRLRSEWLGLQGFKVIRFWNHDVMNNIEGIKEVIALNLGTPHPACAPKRYSAQARPSPTTRLSSPKSRGEGERMTTFPQKGKEKE